MIKSLLGKLKSSPLAKKYLEPILADILEDSFRFNKTIIGTFKDSFGNENQLYAGLRNKIKPGWQGMFDEEKRNRIPSSSELKVNLVAAKRHIKNLKTSLQSYDISLQNKSILEIGCYNGMKTSLLGLENCKSITGSDVTFYYEKQSEDNNLQVDSQLTKLRTSVLNLFSYQQKKTINSKLNFVEDDITQSTLPDNSFDIISSWETLEHVTDIDAAFSNMHRILKPGGIAFHEYNPFFSLNGGHSLCTLDFPWGHCRLNEKDFLKYITDLRPQEYSLASGFYLNSLNRMTLNDLKNASQKADLKILSIIPFVKKSHLNLYSSSALKETVNHYRTIEPIDLISPVVWVIQQKP
jgi:2-polyprenyl-3-methyl-5-hydroxy-6-metoxy-1,4-benzoquinol methylase